jgi:hypothetical protein
VGEGVIILDMPYGQRKMITPSPTIGCLYWEIW